MAIDAHKNFSYSTIATAPSPADSGTSLVIAAGEGTKFPAVSFNATVWPTGVDPSTTNAEIVRVTNISTDTFTITRTQESSSARSIVVGDQIAATISAKTLTDVEQANLLDGVKADTVAQTVTRGSLIYGNSTPKLDEFVVGAADRVLTSDGTDVAWKTREKIVSITIENPTASEDIAICFFFSAVTIKEIQATVVGTSPSVTIDPYHNTSRSGGGGATDILASATAITNTTTGQNLTSFNDATIPADSWLVLKTTAQTGTVTELQVTFRYTYD